MAEITTTITTAYEARDTTTSPAPLSPDTLENTYVETPIAPSTFPDIPTGPVEFSNGVSDLLPENPTKPNTLENVYSSSESGHSEDDNESEEESDEDEEDNESDEDEEDDMCIREEDKEDPAEHIYLVTVDNKVVKYHESRETAMELLSLIKNGIVVNHCGQYTVSVDEMASGFDIHLTSRNILFRQMQTRVLRVLKIYRAEI